MAAITIKVDEKELFKGQLKGNLKDSIQECTNALDGIKYQRTKLVGVAWPEYDWMEHDLEFYWECEQSPFGWCAYHRWEDQAHDDCLFCHQPSERK
jgi:hypothetical protein